MQRVHILMAIGLAMVWGFNFVTIAVGLKDFPPLLFVALRFLLAAVPLLWLGRQHRPGTSWKAVIAIGLMLGVVKFGLLFSGMAAGMPAGLASLVLQAQALFTALFAAAFLGERPSGRAWSGMAVAFFGMGVIGSGLPGSATLTGFLLVLAAAAAWGGANVLTRQARSHDRLGLTLWISLVPPLPLLAGSLAWEGLDRMAAAFANLSLTGIACLLYVVVFATLLGFVVWNHLLGLYAASRVAPFTLLVPVFGLSFSAMLLGEPFTPSLAAGTILVMAGLMLTLGFPELWPRLFRR